MPIAGATSQSTADDVLLGITGQHEGSMFGSRCGQAVLSYC